MKQTQPISNDTLIKKIVSYDDPKRLLLIVVATSVILGTLTGYILANKGGRLANSSLSIEIPKSAQSDIRTFRDFAEGVIQPRTQSSDPEEGYAEGTHLLQREGAVPVALTSSVVDLSQYEGKKVKIFGETQKALKEGWLMDVGRVDEIK